ncbi:MAG TPA: YfiR family protein [Stellaceae bacterium]|nr:YfiR family protein [Stellaceae bacterium]
MTAWAALLPAFFPAATAWGQDNPLEIAIKATYLVKFAGFVEWPAAAFESAASPLNICIVGTPLAGVADRAVAGQAVGQHPLAVRHIAAATHGGGCHILFTAGAVQQPVETALDAVRHEPVLTVTDLPTTAARKGIINFVLQNGHVRFEIDDREAGQDGLRISSQLLALAVNNGSR